MKNATKRKRESAKIKAQCLEAFATGDWTAEKWALSQLKQYTGDRAWAIESIQKIADRKLISPAQFGDYLKWAESQDKAKSLIKEIAPVYEALTEEQQ